MPEPPVIPFGPTASWFESALAYEQKRESAEETLFLQLTRFEVFLVQYGLYWLSRVYGHHAVAVLVEKLHDLIKNQEFCDCPNCIAGRENDEGGTGVNDK